MDKDKAIRAAKLTLGGMLEKKRHTTAVSRADGQIAPSKYLPNVPRQVHASGGKVEDAINALPHVGRNRNGIPPEEAVASPLPHVEYPYMSMTPAKSVYADPLRMAINKAHAEAKIEDVPIDKIVTDVGAIGKSKIKNPAEGVPFVERINGVHHLRDGNHRAAAAFLRGDKSIKALVADMDEAIKANGRLPNGEVTKADGGRVGYEDGGVVGGDEPKNTVKAYKLFKRKKDGKIYPLFVNANKPVPVGQWLEAEEGPQGKSEGKVKSSLGDLAYRPGWHAGDLPVATHIGGKSRKELTAPDYRPDDHVWAEVEMPNDVDWQSVANSRMRYTQDGRPILNTAHITDQLPKGGFYRYKTNPNMTGNWLIGGSMKVNRILSDDEVKQINDAAGTSDLPRMPDIAKADGGAVTDSDEFRNWFGNSVTHTDGQPHVFYTGTSKDKDFTSHNVGRHGAWFTRDPAEASSYADENDSQGYKRDGWEMTPTNRAGRVIAAYVKAENPYTGDLPQEVLSQNYKASQSAWFDKLRAMGHDAWIPQSHGGNLVVALKEPQQIKSIFNNGKFDPKQKHMNKAEGGPVDSDDNSNVTNFTMARVGRDMASTDHSKEAQKLFDTVAARHKAGQEALDMAHSAGAFDNVQMGDVYRYKGLPNATPMEVVSHRMVPIDRWGDRNPPTKVFNGHYPAAELKYKMAGGDKALYPVEMLESGEKYERIAGKPRLVKAGGGMVKRNRPDVSKALAITRGFTKGGKSAIDALKPKGN